MDGDSESNHAAINAWIEGRLTPLQRQEFEAHLATCPECQEHVNAALKEKLSATTRMRILSHATAPPALPEPPVAATSAKPRTRLWLLAAVIIVAALVLGVGYALGFWAWDLANR